MNTLQQRSAETILAKKYDRLASQTAPKPSETLGFYAGWDTDRSLHRATLMNGNTVWGKVLSTGSVGIGDPVTAQLDGSSTIAAFKVTPR
jgi:hypothetical protein